MKIDSFYDLSLLILGDLPKQFEFMNAILAFILAIMFFATVLSVFIFFFRKTSRW